VTVAQWLNGALEAEALLVRYGGEEFLVALPDYGLGPARRAAERLRRLVEASPVPPPDGKGAIAVTLSIGLTACGPRDGADGDIPRLIDRADRALFDAKAEGRNQVTVDRAAPAA
jgi:two-component system cell cycle response regulator